MASTTTAGSSGARRSAAPAHASRQLSCDEAAVVEDGVVEIEKKRAGIHLMLNGTSTVCPSTVMRSVY